MKSLAVSFIALTLILLFWATVLLAATGFSFPHIKMEVLPVFTLIATGCSLFTASMAFYALKTWKRTLRATKRTEFLDQLLTAALEYIEQIDDATSNVRVVHYYLERQGGINPKAIRAVVAADGQSLYKHLNEALTKAQPAMAKLEALIAKGVVFKFNNYDSCEKASGKLVQVHTDIGLMGIILRRDVNDRTWDDKLEIKIMGKTEVQLRDVITVQKKILLDYVAIQYDELHD